MSSGKNKKKVSKIIRREIDKAKDRIEEARECISLNREKIKYAERQIELLEQKLSDFKDDEDNIIL
ncbi:MAG: hypothetical protein ACOC4G_12995 [Bacillota bacterium]